MSRILSTYASMQILFRMTWNHTWVTSRIRTMPTVKWMWWMSVRLILIHQTDDLLHRRYIPPSPLSHLRLAAFLQSRAHTNARRQRLSPGYFGQWVRSNSVCVYRSVVSHDCRQSSRFARKCHTRALSTSLTHECFIPFIWRSARVSYWGVRPKQKHLYVDSIFANLF